MSRVRGVVCLGADHVTEAGELAQRFSAPMLDASHLGSAKPRHLESFIRGQVGAVDDEALHVFLVAAEPLSLLQLTAESSMRLSADLTHPTLNYRRRKGGGRQQMLARAIGLGGSAAPRVLDATAGLGRDAFILASLGAEVEMLERVPEVRALLQSALVRAESATVDPDDTFWNTLKRLSFREVDAIPYLASLRPENRPDVIYLDPMFPPRQKSALVKKEMRILHDLVGADPDAGRLLEAARATGVRRVVVKRPRIAPALSPIKPSHVFSGKSNRFDVYLSA